MIATRFAVRHAYERARKSVGRHFDLSLFLYAARQDGAKPGTLAAATGLSRADIAGAIERVSDQLDGKHYSEQAIFAAAKAVALFSSELSGSSIITPN